MEIIIPEKQKKFVHPLLIFKESWAICWKNMKKMGAIYLIFNLPIAAIYLTPMGNKLQNQKLDLDVFIYVFIPSLILSIWGHIALLLGAKKAVEHEDYTIGQSIGQAGPFFLKYLGTGLIVILFLISLVILGVMSVVAFPLLLKINKILAISICLIAAIADVGFLVYFILRWSLGTVVCVLENIRPVASLRRSLSLVTEYVHPLVGVYCLYMAIYIACLLIFVVIGMFFGLGGDSGESNRIGTIFSTFINTVLMPLWAVITVVLYKKLKEATEANVYA
jgi:hypothetical protein